MGLFRKLQRLQRPIWSKTKALTKKSFVGTQIQSRELDRGIGLRLARELLESPNWVIRIVDSLRFTDSERTRIHTSFDIKVPNKLPEESRSEVLVPLGLYRKGAIRIMDMRGPDGQPLPVSTSQVSTWLAASMLLSLIPRCVPTSNASTANCHSMLRAIASTTNEESEEKFLLEWIDGLKLQYPGCESDQKDWNIFKSLAILLMGHFVLFISLKKSYAGQRCVVKFSMDVDIKAPTRTGTNIRANIANFGMAESHHYEIRLPDELLVGNLTIASTDPSISPTANTSGSIGHLHLGKTAERFPKGWVIAEVEPGDHGPHSLANWVTFAIFIMLCMSISGRLFDSIIFPRGVEFPSTAASLLLAGGSAVLSRHVWDHRHEVTAAVFTPARNMQVLNLLTLLLVAVIFSFPVAPVVWNLLWGVAYLMNAAAVCLYFSNR